MALLRVVLNGDPECAKAEHMANITVDGKPLDHILRMSLGIDWENSGVLQAKMDVCLSAVDVTVDWENVAIYGVWEGKRYQLIEVQE